MEDAYVLIPVAEDVHLGYLEYTESNLVELLFKHLGAAYGWPGDNNSVECSRLLKSVYACFGYNMPRSSQAQANISCSKKLDVSSSSIPEKLKILESAPIGTLLFFDGHSMLYLGMEDGKPYCVSAANSDNMKKEEASSKLYLNTVVLINMTDTLRMDGQSWLEQVETIVIP